MKIQIPSILRREKTESKEKLTSKQISDQIENDPTTKGHGSVKIWGRPIDFHMLEDYMVWKISPYAMKTINRYHHARMIEEMRNYLTGQRITKVSGKTFLIIIACIAMLIFGIIALMYSPQIIEMFKGFGGGGF